MDCTRRHTLITGCSSGIGRATALRLAAAGHHVYAGVRHPADGDQLTRQHVPGAELTPLILDITQASHVAAAATAIAGHTGPAGLDGLVDNGKDSGRLAVLSKLPTPVLDAVRRRIFGLPAPGSLAPGPPAKPA